MSGNQPKTSNDPYRKHTKGSDLATPSSKPKQSVANPTKSEILTLLLEARPENPKYRHGEADIDHYYKLGYTVALDDYEKAIRAVLGNDV